VIEKEVIEKIKAVNLKHIAIIMDGNRRYAKQHFMPSMMGHKKGVEALKKVTRACDDLGIKYLTLYAFSTENWNRTKEEVDFLMDLFVTTITNELKELNENNVKMNFIGDFSRLNKGLQDVLFNSVEKTKNNTGVTLTIAINYGSRDEIVNAVKDIVKDGLSEDKITEEVISRYLYTKNMPDPDLLIRTSGEKRISNYLLWQIAYSEIYVTEKLWPDFDKSALIEAIEDFTNRKRRWGK